ncbi:MAG: ribonuclease Z [Flavobacteriaceae bacterium]|nr:ribonuclease Z [Flavobacteriaceae bacterium]
MIIEKKGNISIVSQEKGTVMSFLEKINTDYNKLKNDNLVLSLFSMDSIPVTSLAEFLQLSKTHTANKRSFVIACSRLNYNEVPEELVVVPSLKEAFDIIEMEEIERDLGL